MNEQQTVFSEGGKNYFKCYIGDVFIGVLSRLPNVNIQNDNNGTPVKDYMEGTLKIIGSALDLLKAIPTTSLDLGKSLKNGFSSYRDVAESLLKMNGISLLGGGVYTRRYYQGNNHLTYSFETILTQSGYVNALNVLNKYTYPTYAGDEVGSSLQALVLNSHPLFFQNMINSDGDLAFKGTARGAMFESLMGELKDVGKYLDDTKSKKGNSIIDHMTSALKGAGYPTKSDSDGDSQVTDEGELRLAKFFGTLTSGDAGDAIIKSARLASGEDPFTTVEKKLKGADELDFINSSALGMGRMIAGVQELAMTPFLNSIKFFSRSSLKAPEKFGLDTVYVTSVENGVESSKIPMTKLIPFPVASGQFIETGNKFCIEDFSIVPMDNINCSTGNPILYRLTTTISTTQKVTTSGLSGAVDG